MSIHPTAIVAEGAVIPASCTIGPFCTVGPNVVLGEDCELVSHVVLDGHTTFGARNKVYPFACIGIAPQDLKYAGEPTALPARRRQQHPRVRHHLARDDRWWRRHPRRLRDCLIMAYVHIGHDSVIGNGCILPNGATLAGHVTVEDFATLSANAPVHQFCTIGRYAYIGGGTTITQDVLPYSLTSIERNNHAYGINKVGLQRKGFTDEAAADPRHRHAPAHQRQAQHLAGTGGDRSSARRQPQGRARPKYLAEFVKKSERGVIK